MKTICLMIFIGGFGGIANLFSQHAAPTLAHWELSYLGEKIFHPGLQIAYTKPVSFSPFPTPFTNRWEYGLAMSTYVHFDNHVGVQLKPQFGVYHVFSGQLEIGVLMEGGYMRRFFAGPTYEVGKSGSVARKRLAGRHALIYGSYLHLGSNRAGNINGFIRLGAFWEYPYHGYSLIHPSLILGIRIYTQK